MSKRTRKKLKWVDKEWEHIILTRMTKASGHIKSLHIKINNFYSSDSIKK